nr:hypothetical protein BgiMline_034482 [Biomphalaria glabrata]
MIKSEKLWIFLRLVVKIGEKNEVFEIISRFNGLEQSADGNQEMYSDYSDNESNYSERSSFSNYSGSRQIIRHLDHERSQSTCDGCKSLKQELEP